jgi:hypothetical protein
MKKILIGFIVFFVLQSPVSASYLKITCAPHAQCSNSHSNAPLFYETNMLPGDTVTKTLTVVNQDKKEACSLKVKIYNNRKRPEGSQFPSQLHTVIRKNGAVFLSNKTIQDLYAQQLIDLSTVPAHGSVVYSWAVTFDPASGNTFQSNRTAFDLSAAFSCDKPKNHHWYDDYYRSCRHTLERIFSFRVGT